MFEKVVKDMYFIFLEVMVATILLALIFQMGLLGSKLELSNEVRVQKQSYVKELSLLHEIADTDITYTGSEVAEIISTNGEKFSYVISIGDNDYIIERDSKEYFLARKQAQIRLDTGSFIGQFTKNGDKQYYIDTELWSPEYLTDSIMKDNIYGTYKVQLLIQKPPDNTEWTNTDSKGNALTIEGILGKVYRIKYIREGASE